MKNLANYRSDAVIKCLGGLVQIKKPINFKRSAFGITGYAVVKASRPLTF